MFFLILRFLPFIIPLALIASFFSALFFTASWPWFLVTVIILDLLYFYLLSRKIEKRKSVDLLINFFSFGFFKRSPNIKKLAYYFFNSLIIIGSGFLFVILLTNQVIIYIFIFLWGFILVSYLESVFNHVYETTERFIISLKNVTDYINLAVVFILQAALANLYIFLDFPLWLALIISAVSSFILIYNYFITQEVEDKTALIYSAVLTLLLVELGLVVNRLPLSFYVSAILMALPYYLLTRFSLLWLKKEWNRKKAWQYLGFAFVALLFVLLTSQWL